MTKHLNSQPQSPLKPHLNDNWTHPLLNFQSAAQQFMIGALIIALTTLAVPSTAEANPFRNLFENCKRIFSKNKPSLAEAERYAFGDPTKPISFGLEVELNIRENPKIVEDYRVPHMDETTWQQTSYEERVQIALEWDRKNTKAHKGTSAYIKMSQAPDWLPGQLKFEGDGNFEINGFVTNKFDELKNYVKLLVDRFGAGSFQSHVVLPAGEAIGAAGYSIFSGDLAQMEALDRGFQQHSKNEQFVPAKNLVHHSLGPLGEKDRVTLRKFELLAQEGESPGNPGSTRITYSSILRGDKYSRGNYGWELRQFHKRYLELLTETDFLSNLLVSGHLKNFSPFQDIELIHPRLPQERAKEYEIPINERSWEFYFRDVGARIENAFPNLMYGGADVNNRFYFPLRDWAHHPAVLALSPEKQKIAVEKIQIATKSLIRDFDRMVTDGKVTDALLVTLQIRVAQWGYESGLTPILQEYKKQIFLDSESARGPPAKSSEAIVEYKAVEKILKDLASTTGERLLAHPQYDSILENSVEIVYQEIGPFGHTWLRVGKKYYDLSFRNNAKSGNINASSFRSRANWGGIIPVAKEKIKQQQAELDLLYKSMNDNNIPPFDAYSAIVKISKNEGGKMIFVSNSPDYSAAPDFKGKVETVDGQPVLKSALGYAAPILIRSGEPHIQAFSCATSVAHVLKHYFDIQVPWTGAKGLKDFVQRRAGPVITTVQYRQD